MSIFALVGYSLQLEEEKKLVKEDFTDVKRGPLRNIRQLLKLLLAYLVAHVLAEVDQGWKFVTGSAFSRLPTVMQRLSKVSTKGVAPVFLQHEFENNWSAIFPASAGSLASIEFFSRDNLLRPAWNIYKAGPVATQGLAHHLEVEDVGENHLVAAQHLCLLSGEARSVICSNFTINLILWSVSGSNVFLRISMFHEYSRGWS